LERATGSSITFQAKQEIFMRMAIGAVISVASIVAALGAAAQSGDAARGERVFNQQCKACHTVAKGGASTIGPNLHGMFGRKAGETEGFQSSDAIKSSGIVWDDTTLADYLKDPKGRVPGTKMVYAGLKRQEQLNDMLAYLKKVTQ
jgi:cytochrome c